VKHRAAPPDDRHGRAVYVNEKLTLELSLGNYSQAKPFKQSAGWTGPRHLSVAGAALMPKLRTESPSGSRAQYVLICSPLAFILTLLCACGGSAKPAVGAVEFVDSSGTAVPAVSSLAVNGVVYLVGTVTNDDEMLGVSWTVNCGSLPPGGSTNGVISTACGVITPAQTLSGPVPSYPSAGYIAEYTAPSAVPKGNTVTITAHATSLPSIVSSVTLTIVASP
jgi:hypothetical protein